MSWRPGTWDKWTALVVAIAGVSMLSGFESGGGAAGFVGSLTAVLLSLLIIGAAVERLRGRHFRLQEQDGEPGGAA